MSDYQADTHTPETPVVAFQKEVDGNTHLHVQTETQGATVTEWLSMEAAYTLDVEAWA